MKLLRNYYFKNTNGFKNDFGFNAAEDEAKYPCDIQLDLENKAMTNGHIGMNGHIHGMNGYIPTITSQLDEKVHKPNLIAKWNFTNFGLRKF